MNRVFVSCLILVLLSSCDQLATSTAIVTFTPGATLTATAKPTQTPLPSTPTPGTKLIEVTDGGFSLLISSKLDTDLKGNTINISDKGSTFIASFTGATYDSSTHTLKNVVDKHLDELAYKAGELSRNEPSAVIVGGIEGISVDLSGTLFDAPIKGVAIAVSPTDNFIVFGLAFSNLSAGSNKWEESGRSRFQELLNSIKFLPSKTTACTISKDKTYGYTKENPIKVGGDAFNGPAREHAYLDNLRGPNGEVVSYEREGSLLTDTTILDGYRVKSVGINTLLYIDEYNFVTPQAPLGLTCAGPFPLTKP